MQQRNVFFWMLESDGAEIIVDSRSQHNALTESLWGGGRWGLELSAEHTPVYPDRLMRWHDTPTPSRTSEKSTLQVSPAPCQLHASSKSRPQSVHNFARTRMRTAVFWERIISDWTDQPDSQVTAGSVITFKPNLGVVLLLFLQPTAVLVECSPLLLQ